MSAVGTLFRRNFEPVVLSVQVVIDLLVILLACWIGWWVGVRTGGILPHASVTGAATGVELYREIAALTAAVCLVTFHGFGLYRPTKSLLNMEEFKAIVKSTLVAFLVLFTLLVYLRSSQREGDGTLLDVLLPIHKVIDLQINPIDVSRVALLATFGSILTLTIISRFMSFRIIQNLHKGGIGNRNVLIYGAGATGRKLQHKFVLVPTLGLNLVGFVDDDPEKQGSSIERVPVLGGFDDLDELVGVHKISEVFVAMPTADEATVMRLIAECDRLGVSYHVVPRFYHLMSFKVRIENLDSIPLITRPERREGLVSALAKRLFDVVFSALLLLLLAPVLCVTAFLIRRESPGPVFFVQSRIGRDGKPFRMFKFRTMHHHMSGDAPTPRSPFDPRITRIGRWLRRYSLDELPQFLNVFLGDMSVVGPRPEMRFIVEQYSPLARERLRVKPGVTGLWQISYARAAAIHEGLDYDLYYIENQSFLLDLVIVTLTVFAVVKGTGAY